MEGVRFRPLERVATGVTGAGFTWRGSGQLSCQEQAR